MNQVIRLNSISFFSFEIRDQSCFRFVFLASLAFVRISSCKVVEFLALPLFGMFLTPQTWDKTWPRYWCILKVKSCSTPSKANIHIYPDICTSRWPFQVHELEVPRPYTAIELGGMSPYIAIEPGGTLVPKHNGPTSLRLPWQGAASVWQAPARARSIQGQELKMKSYGILQK